MNHTIRQKHSLLKARPLQIEGNHPQLQQGDDVSAIQTPNQDKASNQSNVEAERRLKSIIECSAEVLEEAQHLWHLGENIGMEAATTNSDILHSYASMECRDRKEAMEVDDIPCVGKPLMIGYVNDLIVPNSSLKGIIQIIAPFS